MKTPAIFGQKSEFFRFLTICLIQLASLIGTNAKCSVQLKINNKQPGDDDYFSAVFDKLSAKKYKTSDGRFELGICEAITADGIKADAKAGLIDTAKKVVIGRFDDVTAGMVEASTAVIYFRYGGGGTCKNTTYQPMITVVCGPKASLDHFSFAGIDDTCAYNFFLTTSSLCDVPRSAVAPVTAPPLTSPPTTTVTAAPATASSATSKSHMNPFTGFILFLLALAFGYCVVGFLYKRYVLGARGAQQIPNYLFWIRVSQSIQDCISNRSSNRYTSTASRTAEYDRANAADVQLMNDGEEFKYDQPPLTAGQGAGQASTFRQQPLNVVPSGNTPSLNAQRQQQQQPLLLPQDDADERLLQV